MSSIRNKKELGEKEKSFWKKEGIFLEKGKNVEIKGLTKRKGKKRKEKNFCQIDEGKKP